MNIKKLFVRMSIGIGIVGMIIILLLVLNSKSSDCKEGEYNVTEGEINYCYYINVSCAQNEQAIEEPLQENQTEQLYKCVYTPKGFMDNKVFIFILIFLGVGWLIIFIIFLIDTAKKGDKSLELGTFRKEDFVNADRGRQLWALHLCKEWGIPTYGGENGDEKYQESLFNFYTAQNVFQKGQEWFVKFQCDVLGGKNPGLYTVIISLSRGEKWILNGMVNYQETYYDNYKMSKAMPLHTAENLQERYLQELAESNPEKAQEYQQKILEQQMENPNLQHEQVTPDVPQQNIPYGYMPRPRYQPRRPFYRRY